MSEFRSGFVALVGRPNVGKSTLVNQMMGHKVAIVSDKPQTTRHQIRAVLTSEASQIVFLDTPGIHRPRHRLGERMVRTALAALEEVDVVVHVVDVAAGIGPGDKHVAETLQTIKTPILLAANKMDVAKVNADEAIASCRDGLPQMNYAAIVPVSAMTGVGTDALQQHMVERLPAGPQYYPAEWVTDQPERIIVAEHVREKVLHYTKEEIPHAVAVNVERMERRASQDMVDIEATVYVERESQRGIIIGKQGQMIRQIGTEARRDTEALLGSPVNLQLWVKVKRDWRNKEGALREFGYDE